jgi:hypothetical protein
MEKEMLMKTCQTLSVLFTLMLMVSFAIQADDLFDSQMKLAKQGDAEAQFKVGEMYETGIGVEQDKSEAMYWTIRSANQKHETAGFKLLYWSIEIRGLNSENKAKLENLKIKANQGNAQAQYYLGKMYAHGIGMDKDPDVAIDWLNKAALAGMPEAEPEITALAEEKKQDAPKESGFNSDPCSDKTARFLSTCR